MIETQKVLDLKVNLMASYVIIPQTGFYNGTQNILLLDLGHFKVGKCQMWIKIDSRLEIQGNLPIYAFMFLWFYRCPVKAGNIYLSCVWVPATLRTSCPELTIALMYNLKAYSFFIANQVHTRTQHSCNTFLTDTHNVDWWGVVFILTTV